MAKPDPPKMSRSAQGQRSVLWFSPYTSGGWTAKERPGGAPMGLGSQRPEAGDPVVVAPQVAHQGPEHGLDVEGAGGRHLLEVGPVPRAVEERLEDGQVPAREERQLVVEERLEAGPRCGT